VSVIAEQESKRLNINLELSLHNAFKAATAARGENMTDVLLEFIQDYVARYSYDTRKGTKKKDRR
jgi:ParG protein